MKPALSLNVIGHVGIRIIHLYVSNFNEKVSPLHGFIKNG
ncbi:arsenate reductase [Salmonella enterica]|nr:arsenate reductase [Salmonella enterica]EJX4201187.1 arsenate reductase [Salmonella enterica]EJX4228788.1 arsenate reductase [Salmonella enterica]EJX4271038.1 arsenate reductase [Salmonella enterica]EJX4531338.1 arsenate reductase [Salmonella enterica]